ncbi:MAG: hypothetical protein H0W73_00065 [Bacteroidetes bacterium]|nr:hypothetical protein [Bacteroidota bacterium]
MKEFDYFKLFSLSSEHLLLKDRLGRSQYFTYRGNDIFSPLVSELIYNSGFRPEYPQGKKFAVCLSHDIDALYSTEATPLYKGGLKNIFDISRFEIKRRLNVLKKRSLNAEWSVEKTLNIEGNYDVKSTFYFLSLLSGEQDYNYDVNEITDQFKMVKDAGSEIGLHGGHQAYIDFDKLSKEKKQLAEISDSEIVGYRNHYLRFTTPESWLNLQNCGFKYDTTLGYSDCVGFRNGMCYPFYPYDYNNNVFLNIVELPLVVMDVTILSYMKLTSESAFALFKDLVKKVKAVNGVFTLLWHNNYMVGEWGKFYAKCIEFLNMENAWFATSSDITNWYSEKGYLNQIRDIINSEVINKNG